MELETLKLAPNENETSIQITQLKRFYQLFNVKLSLGSSDGKITSFIFM